MASPRTPKAQGTSLLMSAAIERGVDDRLALRHRHAEVRFGEAAADAEDQVRFLEEVVHRPGMARPPEPSASGCVSGKALLPSRLVQTGMASSSASALQLVPGLRPVHALAGIEHRPLRLREHRRGLTHGLQVGRRSRSATGGVVESPVDLLVRTCRPAPRPAPDRRGRCASARRRGGRCSPILRRRGHRLGRLGDVAHLTAGVVVAADMRDAARIAHRASPGSGSIRR